MQIISLLGKGGTAKTTSTATLAHAFARRGKRVLMVDLDSQASLSNWLVSDRPEGRDVESVLLGNSGWDDVIVNVSENLDFAATLPFGLKDVEDHIRERKRRREHVIGDALRQLDDRYDYCFLDTPRGLDTEINVNVFECMDWAILVTEPAPMSLTANQEIIGAVRACEAPDWRGQELLLGALPTRYLSTTLSGLAIEGLAGNEKLRVFTPIRHTVRTAEAVAVDSLLYDYDPSCTASEDYESVADEMLAVTEKRK